MRKDHRFNSEKERAKMWGKEITWSVFKALILFWVVKIILTISITIFSYSAIMNILLNLLQGVQ